MTPYRSPLVNIQLSKRRKGMIMSFKEANKSGTGSRRWVRKLFEFLNSNDNQILQVDVMRWVETFPWITVSVKVYNKLNEFNKCAKRFLWV